VQPKSVNAFFDKMSYKFVAEVGEFKKSVDNVFSIHPQGQKTSLKI